MTPDPAVHRARVALLGMFFILGVNTSSWLARLPTIKESLGLTSADLGVVMLGGAIGSLVMVTFAGAIVQRFGGYRVLVTAALASFVALALEGIGPTTGHTWILVVGLVLNGMSISLLNVPQNVETASVERRMGRSVLPQFHAAFSIGAFLGTLIGAACSWMEVSVLAQFLTMTTITVVWRLVSIPHVVHDTLLHDSVRWERADAARGARVRKAEVRAGVVQPHPESTGVRAVMRARRRSVGSALGAWREPRTLFIGLVIMSASLSEGSANNWLSIAVHDDLKQTESVAALFFGGFIAAMTIIRIVGTGLIDRYGRVLVLRVSGVVSLVGLLLFGFGPHLALVGLGVILWGLGAALAVPLGISAASDDPLKAAGRVSVVSAFGSMSSLVAPPLLGLAADAIGARHALTLIVVAMVVSISLSKYVAKIEPETPVADGDDADDAEARTEAATLGLELAVAENLVSDATTVELVEEQAAPADDSDSSSSQK